MFIQTDEKKILAQLINIFYRAAGEKPWHGEINDHVAEVFAHMLLAAQRCLNDYSWTIILTDQPITAKWLIYQIEPHNLEKMAQLNGDTSCIEFVIEKWNEKLRLAADYHMSLEQINDFDECEI